MSKNNSSYGRLNVLKRLVNGDGVVCFLGVGGVSMSSLLALSSYFGIRTFGIDRREGEYVSELIEDGEELSCRTMPSFWSILLRLMNMIL